MASDIELDCIDSFEDSHSLSLQSELLLTYKKGNVKKFIEKLRNGIRSEYIDVNHFYGNPINGTLLEIACTENNKSLFVDVLIYYGAEINIINDLSKKAPIHVAVEKLNLEAVKFLVRSKRLDINIKDGNGNTVLHIAVLLDNLQIIDILFEHKDLDINALNSSGQTPLHVALIKDNESSIRLLLHRFDIDLDSYNYNDQSCRDIIKQKYPDIKFHIDGNKNLFSLIKDRNSKKFIEMARINRPFLHENDGKYTYLQWACEKNLTDVVETLLHLGVNPNDYCPGTNPPLVLACRGGSYDILNALMKHSAISLKPVQGINALHAIFDGIHKHWLFFTINQEDYQYYNCLKTLFLETSTSKTAMMQNKLDINYPDLEENTILHRAAYIHDDRFVKKILHHGASIGAINKKGEYALELIKPSIFQEYLDSCISHNEKPGRDSSYIITYDYTMLIPSIKQPFSSKKKNLESGEQTRYAAIRTETDPLLRMSNIPELRSLLKHPVITSFLNLKWQIIRKFFYINLAIHLSFLLFLTLYILRVYNYSPYNMQIPGGNDTVNKLQCFKAEKDTWLWTLSLLFCAILGFRELIQYVLSPWLYLKHPQNWLELTSIAVSIAMLFCQNEYFSSLAILLSASELILLIGQHPYSSTYIEMFKTVTWNFLKFLTWYAVLILAFGFSFYILFKGDPNGNKLFEGPFSSVFKTIVMMTGEFDTGSISFDRYSIFNHFFFLSFIFFIAIVLFGLLNGLAVSDIQAIRADAEIVGIVSRIKLISYFEGLTFCDPLTHSNSSNEPSWLSACYELRQRLWQKKTKLFSRILKIDLFFDILPGAKAHVYPNRDNKVEFLSEDALQEKNSRHNFNNSFISWKMDPNIVKASRIIIESSTQTGQVEEMIKNCSERLQVFESKFESIENILMEIKMFWKEKSK